MNKNNLTAGKTNTIKCCGSPPDILGGFLFVIIGIILLLNNFNIIPWSIWGNLSVFWPVILVFLGLDMISGNSWLLKLITTTIGVIIFTFIIIYSLSAVNLEIKNIIHQKYPVLENIFQWIQPNKLYPDFKIYDGSNKFTFTI